MHAVPQEEFLREILSLCVRIAYLLFTAPENTAAHFAPSNQTRLALHT